MNNSKTGLLLLGLSLFAIVGCEKIPIKKFDMKMAAGCYDTYETNDWADQVVLDDLSMQFPTDYDGTFWEAGDSYGYSYIQTDGLAIFSLEQLVGNNQDRQVITGEAPALYGPYQKGLRIQKNGSEIGVFYFLEGNGSLIRECDGAFFLKRSGDYIELSNVNFTASQLCEILAILETVG